MLRYIIGIRFVIELKPEHSPTIYASRHESAWESLFLPFLLPGPVVVIAKISLFKIPFFGKILRTLNIIPVDFSNKALALQTILQQSKIALQQGKSILIFPEGERMPVNSFRKMKHGIGSIYQETSASISPIVLNAGECWAKRAFLKRPGTIFVRELDTIPGQLYTKEEILLLLVTIIEQHTKILYLQKSSQS